MKEVLQQYWDYALFATGVISAMLVLRRCLWRDDRLLQLSWLLLGLLVLSGWYFVDWAGKNERRRIEQMLVGYAPTYARECQELGHEKVTFDTPPDDPVYLKIIEAQKRWLSANPAVSDIYTARKRPDGQVGLVVDSETDYNRNGVYDGEREERTPIGEPCPLEAFDVVFAGGIPRFDNIKTDITTDRWGTWVAALAPIFGPDGKVDAILGVDFDAGSWLTSIRRARWTAIGYLSIVGLIIVLGAGLSARQLAMRDMEAQRRQQQTLSMENAKLETLINSIDGIVWECDAKTLQFHFVSRQSERILGYTPEQWMGNPHFWMEKIHPADSWAYEQCLRVIERRQPYFYDYRMVAADGRIVWIRESGAILCSENNEPLLVRGVFLDITSQRRWAEELEQANEALRESSRLAGMAEVATGVLHNVGNVLNSVNVSGTLLRDKVNASRVGDISRIATILRRAPDGGFSKGTDLPQVLERLAEILESEHRTFIDEVESIIENVRHIKSIVAMQQSNARSSGLSEPTDLAQVVEQALQINLTALNRHGIEVHRVFTPVPTIQVDKHKVLQILVNLVRNAKEAMSVCSLGSRKLTVKVCRADKQRVAIEVQDSGIGISPENLAHVFHYGFTTKEGGHGFGLHSSALAAAEMHGELSVQSKGLGEGAIFTLTLPAHKEAGGLDGKPAPKEEAKAAEQAVCSAL